MGKPIKILAIQTKSLGDAVMVIPALQAIRRRYPDSALHALVPEAVAPLLQHEPSLTRLWTVPRVRGRADFKQNWPVIRALRAERFDRSVDFAGNDRGAILSFICGAHERLGTFGVGGFIGRRFCYTQSIPSASHDRHETLRLLHILSAWGITPPASVSIQLHTDTSLDAAAAQLLPEGVILCHIGSSLPEKEWPVGHWAAFYRMAALAGHKLIFNTGADPREQALLQALKQLVPQVAALPPSLDLATFLAVIKRAKACISNDTGPMHFAAALGVPTIGLFGPTPVIQWRPIGPQHEIVQSPKCSCIGSAHIGADHRMADIQPEEVFRCLQKLIASKQPC